MRRTTSAAAGVGLAVVLAFTVSACSTSTQSATVASGSSGTGKASSAKTSNKATVGQTLNITGDGGLKAAVTLKSVAGHATGTGDIAEKPAHGSYVVANVQISVTAGTYDFNPLYFKFVGTDGNSYDIGDGNAITAGFDPTLSSGTLGTGDKTGGNLVFDAPSAHGTLQLTDPLGSTVGSWTF